MSILTEGNLRFDFSAALNVRRFDDQATHGLSHCMKAVDFIVELQRRTIFVEVKDPDNPNAKPANRSTFIQELQSGVLENQFTHKFRDSFLYEWASDSLRKPVHYVVLVALQSLTSADLLTRTDALKRVLPAGRGLPRCWARPIAGGCIVVNLATWSSHPLLGRFPVSRLP